MKPKNRRERAEFILTKMGLEQLIISATWSDHYITRYVDLVYDEYKDKPDVFQNVYKDVK